MRNKTKGRSLSVNDSQRGIHLFSGFFNRSGKYPLQHGFEVKEELLVFVGGSKYAPIPFDQVESVFYRPRDDNWQEVSIKILDKGTMNYYLNSNIERLQKAVDNVNHQLEPSQPLCKFILSAKQGSLSSKD